MRAHSTLALLALAVLLCATQHATAQTTARYQGVARLAGTGNQLTADGLAQFYALTTGPVTNLVVTAYVVKFDLTGLPANTTLSAKVRQWGDVSSNGAALGNIFNPTGATHACAPNARQVGDLISSFTTTENGTFQGNFTLVPNPTNQGAWFQNATSMIGRALAIHAAVDDCTGTDGNAGVVLAQAVIGVPNTAFVGNLVPYANVTGQVFRAELRRTNAAAGTTIRGSVYFWFDPDQAAVTVYARLRDLTPGMSYGFHVHTFGDQSVLSDGTSAGAHYDPLATGTHRMPYETNSQSRHMGDMGNVIAQPDGQVYVRQTYSLLRMFGYGSSIQNILGRSVVLHALPDQGNFGGATGSAGARYAVGVIGVTSATELPPPDSAPTSSAVARMYGTNDAPTASGLVRMVTDPLRAGTTFYVNVNGLAPSTVVSMHIRQYGDITAPSGYATGGHWNPLGWQHGCPVGTQAGYRAMGDLGNFVTAANGTLFAQFTVDLVALFGRNSVIGRSLVIWSAVDTCDPNGHSPDFMPAGVPSAQGVIGIEGNATNAATNPNTFVNGLDVTNYTYVASLSPTTSGAAGSGGYVWIRQDAPGAPTATVYARMWGLAPHSIHGFHLHMYGDLTAGDGTSTGAHLDFAGNPHALPSESSTRHMGDMGNVQAWEDGGVYFTAQFPFSFDTLQNIVGRGVILHADPDRGQIVPGNGGAGARILMGVIGIAGTPMPAIVNGPSGYAMARLLPTTGSNVAGSVYFSQGYPFSNETTVVYSLAGLAANARVGLHIRTHGDVSSADGSATGAIWNPYNAVPGCASALVRNRTMGLLGNVVADAQGVAQGRFAVVNTEMFGANSMIGRALTVSDTEDPCNTVTPPGSIKAQGVIGVARSTSSLFDGAGNTQPAVLGSTVLMATMQATAGNEQYNGTVWFRQSQLYSGRIEVYARFKGCRPGKLYGFHVHNFGDWTDRDGGAAGAHWDPFPAKSTHALPDETWVERLAGEMGNVMCSNDGQIYFNRHFDLMMIGGPQNIIGRGMILHGAVDQGTSQPPLTNFRVTLGVIGITAQPFPATYDTAPAASALAVMYGTVNNPSASGWVRFTQQPYNATVRVEWSFTGLQQNGGAFANLHSIHVHSYGDMTANDGTACGVHFNPYGWTHQCYPRGRHVGDLGNITQTAAGVSQGAFEVDLITLFGSGSILGRSVIVHQYWDDCTNTGDDSDCGNCGVRLAQGVIGTMSTSTSNTNYVAAVAGTIPTAGAVAVLSGSSSEQFGSVFVVPKRDAEATTLLIMGRVFGLSDGTHGVHVRQFGDVRSGTDAGTLYRAFTNVEVSGGQGSFAFTVPRAGFPFDDLIGRSVVVSTSADADSTPGGAPVLMGTIGLASSGPDQTPTEVQAAASVSPVMASCVAAVAVALMAFGAAQ